MLHLNLLCVQSSGYKDTGGASHGCVLFWEACRPRRARGLHPACCYGVSWFALQMHVDIEIFINENEIHKAPRKWFPLRG